MWKSVVAISPGASLGALFRWMLGTKLNNLFPTIPPGTLAANLIGGYIIGLAVAFFVIFSHSGAMATIAHHGLLRRPYHVFHFFPRNRHATTAGPLSWGLGGVAVHAVSSVAMTFAGIATVAWTRG